MHVKICGLTNRSDADRAAAHGADYLGCVCVPGTPRAVDADAARTILHGHSGDVTGVLVFRNTTFEEVTDAIRRSGLITVQLHQTTVEVIEALARSGVVVHRVFDAELNEVPHLPDQPDLIHHLDVNGGGSGETFDWAGTLSPQAPPRTFIAGGITPENVQGLLAFRPFGIDVSSGIESDPGVKCPERLSRLFQAIRDFGNREEIT